MEPRPPADSIVAFATGVSVNVWFQHSLHNLYKTDARNRFGADYFSVMGPYVHQNRNQIQAEFLDRPEPRDWLFMVDNDMVFEPDDVWRLFEEADERGPGIYSAAYLLENGVLVCGPWDDEVEMVYHPMVGLPKQTAQVGMVGMGFTLIHRDVLEAVGENAFSPIAENRGEDLSFCWRAREHGYIPWIVPACNPGHHKTVVLYPHDSVRNMIGEEVNLVVTDPNHKRLNEEMLKGAN